MIATQNWRKDVSRRPNLAGENGSSRDFYDYNFLEIIPMYIMHGIILLFHV